MVDLSLIIPVYNEGANIVPLYNAITRVLAALNKKTEIIFIDDGSTDGSYERLYDLKQKDSRVLVIKFKRNFGQTPALDAGIHHAKGKIIVTLDADMQNDPADIPRLLKKLDEGYDVVSGWRHSRHDALITKRIPSLISNWLARRLTGIMIHDSGCTLKAYRREALEGIRLYGEMHRFIPAIVSGSGFKVTEIPTNHLPRQHGHSKYGMGRLAHGFLDLIYIKFWNSYSTRPLHFFGFLGLGSISLSLIIVVEQIIKALVIKAFWLGPLLLLAVLLFITGILLIMFGFLSEILIRTYYSGEDRQPYTIEKII